MNEQGGYIKLYRKSLHSPIWKNQNMWRFWTWCLMKAAYKQEVDYAGYLAVVLRPGQFLYSRRMAQRETGLSERAVTSCLKALSEGENASLAHETHRSYSVVTVVKMPVYQGWENQNAPQPHHETHRDRTTTAPPLEEKGDGLPSKTSEGDPRVRAPAKQVVEELKETQTHTRVHASGNSIDALEASMSPTYRHVLDMFADVTGRKSRDAATKEGARTLAQAVDAGDLDAEHLRHVIEAGMNDPNLKNQTLRGVARNFGNYLPSGDFKSPDAINAEIEECERKVAGIPDWRPSDIWERLTGEGGDDAG